MNKFITIFTGTLGAFRSNVSENVYMIWVELYLYIICTYIKITLFQKAEEWWTSQSYAIVKLWNVRNWWYTDSQWICWINISVYYIIIIIFIAWYARYSWLYVLSADIMETATKHSHSIMFKWRDKVSQKVLVVSKREKCHYPYKRYTGKTGAKTVVNVERRIFRILCSPGACYIGVIYTSSTFIRWTEQKHSIILLKRKF